MTAFLATPALAQPTARDAAAARSLFAEGVACADAQDWACAADRFERASEIRPSPVLSYNLGKALLALGRLVEGSEHLQQVVRSPAANDALRSSAQEAIDAVAARIGRLVVHATGDLHDVEFTIDGIGLPQPLLGSATPIDPGPHVIEAHRQGELLAEDRITIPDGSSGEVVLAIRARRAAPGLDPLAPTEASASPTGTLPAATLTPDSGVPESDATPWIALGIGGGVAVVVGAIVLAVVLAAPDAAQPFDGNLGHVEFGR